MAEHFVHLLRILAIALRMSIHKNRLRTEFRRRPQRHARVHAKLARRVTCDGDEEGVQVDVKDGARGGAHRSPGCLAEVYRECGLAPASESRYPAPPLFFAKCSKIRT